MARNFKVIKKFETLCGYSTILLLSLPIMNEKKVVEYPQNVSNFLITLKFRAINLLKIVRQLNYSKKIFLSCHAFVIIETSKKSSKHNKKALDFLTF